MAFAGIMFALACLFSAYYFHVKGQPKAAEVRR